jgi:hypothetical protein
MAIKRVELELMANGEGCLGKAADDELLFVLRAKDPAAAMVVRIWSQIAASQAMHEPEKLAEAFELATQMDAWRKAHIEPWRWSND